jgi:hypothetical protein
VQQACAVRTLVQVEEHDRSQSYAAFNFSQYLATCHDTCLAAVVEVPSSAWVILLLGLGPLRGFLQIMNTPIKVCRAVFKPMTIL